MSLTHRLLALTLVASLPGLAAVGYGSFDLRNTRYAEVRAEAMRNAQVVASEIGQIFDGIQGTLHAVAESDEISRLNDTACTDYVARVRQSIRSLTAILIVGLDGNIRCVSEPSLASPNLANRDYFREAVDQRKFTIGPFIASKLSNRHIIPMAVPIVRDDKVEGVVMAGLDLEWLGRQLKKRGVQHGGAVLLADRTGTVVAREPAPEKYIGKQLINNAGRVARSEPGSEEIVGLDGVARIIGYIPASLTPFGMYVSSGIANSEAFGPIDRALRNSIALFALGSAVAFILAWVVGEGIIRRPLMRMVATAEAWRRGHDAARTGIIGRSDEIGILGPTLDRLMDENAMREEMRATAEERREILVHELAHRVKNTLATVQSIASLTFRNSQGPEALRQFHDRLQALVRSHDLLTRKNWQHADLSEIAETAIAPLKEERAHRFAISGPPVSMPPTTAVPMAMILHELCTNALKYGALSNENGRVIIAWTAKPEPAGTAVSLIWNESGGPAVQPPEEEGFGTRLIGNLSRQLGGDCSFRYPPSGLVCHISILSPRDEPRND
ncbi:HWE histidine kinase domain-containing protein [soil metagenome]